MTQLQSGRLAMKRKFISALVVCFGASALGSPANAAAVIGGTLGAGAIPSVAISAGAVAGVTAAINPTTWWGKALSITAGSIVTGVIDPPAGTFYNGDFTIHYNPDHLSLVQTGWLGEWGADPSLLAPPVDPSGGFPTGATFVLQEPNPQLNATTVNDESSGTVTTQFDWGPSGKAMVVEHFNFFGFAFEADRDIALQFLGTVSASPAAPSLANISDANLFVTTNGMFCSPPNEDEIQRCGPPETMYFRTSAIPEPATWAMLVLGFGVVAYSLRRRSRHGVQTVSMRA